MHSHIVFSYLFKWWLSDAISNSCNLLILLLSFLNFCSQILTHCHKKQCVRLFIDLVVHISQYDPPFLLEGTKLIPTFWKEVSEKENECLGDLKSSCHRYLSRVALCIFTVAHIHSKGQQPNWSYKCSHYCWKFLGGNMTWNPCKGIRFWLQLCICHLNLAQVGVYYWLLPWITSPLC